MSPTPLVNRIIKRASRTEVECQNRRSHVEDRIHYRRLFIDETNDRISTTRRSVIDETDGRMSTIEYTNDRLSATRTVKYRQSKIMTKTGSREGIHVGLRPTTRLRIRLGSANTTSNTWEVVLLADLLRAIHHNFPGRQSPENSPKHYVTRIINPRCWEEDAL